MVTGFSCTRTAAAWRCRAPRCSQTWTRRFILEFITAARPRLAETGWDWLLWVRYVKGTLKNLGEHPKTDGWSSFSLYIYSYHIIITITNYLLKVYTFSNTPTQERLYIHADMSRLESSQETVPLLRASQLGFYLIEICIHCFLSFWEEWKARSTAFLQNSFFSQHRVQGRQRLQTSWCLFNATVHRLQSPIFWSTLEPCWCMDLKNKNHADIWWYCVR